MSMLTISDRNMNVGLNLRKSMILNIFHEIIRFTLMMLILLYHSPQQTLASDFTF